MSLRKLSVFIFRRDLRLDDNIGLLEALRSSAKVFPCFIFDTVQIDPNNNSFFSSNCVQFMIESLRDLNTQLEQHDSRLFLFHGSIEDIIKNIITNLNPDALHVNEDFTPYSLIRDKKIADLCKLHSVEFCSHQDIMLHPKEEIMMQDGKPFPIFSHYFQAAKKVPVREPVPNTFSNFYSAKNQVKGEYPLAYCGKFYIENPDLEVRGGRENALKILDHIKEFKNYNKTRHFPSQPTTKLSAYNKFGCASIREVYEAIRKGLGKNFKLIKELIWRDFYYYLVYYNPQMLETSFKPEYQEIEWHHNEEWFQKWKDGQTGCPIVDAGMRHLNTKGYMPNRLRLICAHFLVKDLLINWKLGEQYFAQKLVDYDPCQNNGGWQFCAGTGADYKPYLRIYNFMTQSEKFDKDCVYIFKWIPELKNCKPEHVHKWENSYVYYKRKNLGYPDPLFKHADQRKKCIEMYDKAKEGKELTHYPDIPGVQRKYPRKKSKDVVKAEENDENKSSSTQPEQTKKTRKRKETDEEVVNPDLKKTKKTLNTRNTNLSSGSNHKISDWFNLLQQKK